ncbi:phage tail protein [Sphingomonas aerolata]|uniref:phage tail protein n=1 Tax=Sphingomonas aerolata TaxID=185951 RepID=UPI002FDFD000
MVTGDGVAAGGRRASATFAESIIREVGRVKPLREHMRLVQQIAAAGAIGLQAVLRAISYTRADALLTVDTSPDWAAYVYGAFVITGIDDRAKAFFPDGTPRQIDFAIDLLRVDSDVA